MSTTADALHLKAHEAHDAHEADHKPGFFTRWFMSTNHKDIGTLYLIFAIVAGVIGGGISGIMRWELMEPGIQVLNHAWPIGAGTANFDEWAHHWNVLVTAHGADHGVLHGHAGDDRRLRQLDRAADDRRARHGLPADEQHQLLAARPRLPPAAGLDLCLGRNRPRSGDRLDALCAAIDLGLVRACGRHDDLLAPPRRRQLDPRCDQFHHHHLQHARARHDPAQDAACSCGRCW